MSNEHKLVAALFPQAPGNTIHLIFSHAPGNTPLKERTILNSKKIKSATSTTRLSNALHFHH